MIFAIDTSAYSSAVIGDETVKDFFSLKHEIKIPIIVIAELRAGFKNGSKYEQNEAMLSALLDAPNTEILLVSEKTTYIYADVYVKLRKAGRPINVNDMWIAALCLEHNIPLLTKDNDFKNTKELTLI